MSTVPTLRNLDLEPCNRCYFKIIPLCGQVLKQHPASSILDAHLYPFVVIVQSLSCIWLFVTPWTVARQAPLSSTVSQSLLKSLSIELMMPSNHLILCCPLLLLPSVFPSIWIFSSKSALHIRWPKYWSFNFNISPSNEHSGLISFTMDWLDLLAVQRTLNSLLQHNSKASILQCSAFFRGPTLTSIHDYWKNHSFDYMDLCCKMISLLFNMQSRF